MKNKIYDIAKLGLSNLAEKGASLMCEADFLSNWLLNREEDGVSDKILHKYRLNLTSMMRSASKFRAEMGTRVYKKYPELYGENLHFNNDFTECSILSDSEYREKDPNKPKDVIEKSLDKLSDDIKEDKNSSDSKEMYKAIKLASKQKKASA